MFIANIVMAIRIILEYLKKQSMKWLSITSNSHQHIYELWNKEEKLLKLNYHPVSGALRISANDEKRVFLIGREGFLRSRTVLRNEYGIRMGQLNYEGSQENQGNIEVYNERFTYSLQDSFPPKSTIYRNAEIIVQCELPAIQKNINSAGNYELLILTLCWYMSAIKKQIAEYA
jgi:hypothetical protein